MVGVNITLQKGVLTVATNSHQFWVCSSLKIFNSVLMVQGTIITVTGHTRLGEGNKMHCPGPLFRVDRPNLRVQLASQCTQGAPPDCQDGVLCNPLALSLAGPSLVPSPPER